MNKFTDFLFESSVKDMTPDEYRDVLKDKYPDNFPPETGDVPADKEYHNPPEEEHTGNRKACGNIMWIEYWRRLIGFKGNHLKCTFCGADIYIDVDLHDAYTMRMNHPLTSKEAYQAEGGHYHKNGKDYTDGYIIIPVCKSCNAKNEDFKFNVVVNNKYVEEIGATLKENKE